MSAYNELLHYSKELELLHTKLTTSPEKEDYENFRLLKKIFNTYERIKNNVDVKLDTILSMPSISNTHNKKKPKRRNFEDYFREHKLAEQAKAEAYPELDDKIKTIDDLYCSDFESDKSDDERVHKQMAINGLNLDHVLKNKIYDICA